MKKHQKKSKLKHEAALEKNTWQLSQLQYYIKTSLSLAPMPAR